MTKLWAVKIAVGPNGMHQWLIKNGVIESNSWQDDVQWLKHMLTNGVTPRNCSAADKP